MPARYAIGIVKIKEIYNIKYCDNARYSPCKTFPEVIDKICFYIENKRIAKKVSEVPPILMGDLTNEEKSAIRNLLKIIKQYVEK